MKYKIKKIKPTEWYGFDTEIYLVVRDKEIFITREHSSWKWDIERLIKKIKDTREEKGFFCEYGEGHPLKEFEEDFSSEPYLEEREEGIWYFLGDHKRTFPAFRYFIWDSGLVKEIKERLEEWAKNKF